MPDQTIALSADAIAPMVHWIRHEKVMLDSDLATLYGIEARVLNQAVKRISDVHDVVLANPPYSIKQWNREAFAADPWGRNRTRTLGAPLFAG